MASLRPLGVAAELAWPKADAPAGEGLAGLRPVPGPALGQRTSQFLGDSVATDGVGGWAGATRVEGVDPRPRKSSSRSRTA